MKADPSSLMDDEPLYSIRMRASVRERHLSGAEGIVPSSRLTSSAEELMGRAMRKGTVPDRIVVTIDSLDGLPVRRSRALDVVTLACSDTGACRSVAGKLLSRLGVSPGASASAIEALSSGAAPSGGVMRGAMIMDADRGERLEPDQERGVRASRFDWTEHARDRSIALLGRVGLTHFRTLEALALATKGAHAPGIVAELCWSDDPDYTAGYVASLRYGYVRFPHLKARGDTFGGRVYFVTGGSFDRDVFIAYLQRDVVLVDRPGTFHREIRPEEFFRSR